MHRGIGAPQLLSVLDAQYRCAGKFFLPPGTVGSSTMPHDAQYRCAGKFFLLNDIEMDLVESLQSVVNRLDAVCWDATAGYLLPVSAAPKAAALLKGHA
jgi:hypothetical protein